MNSNQRNQAKAEFFLCLARAFTPPENQPAVLAAFKEYLVHDLTELGTACGYPISEAVANFAKAMASVADAQSLRVIYSRLFLTPGDKHPSLNTGAYIDGSVGGGSVTAMATCYQRCGLEKQETLHDLPDHVVVQLEFVAWLYAAEAEGEVSLPMRAEDFISSFMVRWASAFRVEIEAATGHFELDANPYAALAGIIEIAALADARALEAPKQEVDPEIARLRAEFAGREFNANDLAVIEQRLKADHLASDHIARLRAEFAGREFNANDLAVSIEQRLQQADHLASDHVFAPVEPR